jgi:hypothetical protein
MPRQRVKHGDLFIIEEADRDMSYPPSDDGKTYKPYIPGVDVLKPDQVLREEPSLDVHWNRDGEYVQIAIDAPTDWWKRFWDSHKDDKEVIAFSAFTDRLTRREINDLIKTLRRARDAAYGADE